jgi:thiosulfate dehydrogenase
MQNIYDRVNDYFERSLNGSKMDTNTREMQAIYTYLKWVGDDVLNGTSKAGTGIVKLKYLKRAASTIAGGGVYIANCQTCHGVKDEEKLNIDMTGYTYLPL